MRRPAGLALLASGLLAASICSCGHSGGAPSTPAPKPAQIRIVSFSPAISRTLVDFHLQDRVVGRTPFCTSLDPGIAVVGDLLNVNYETLTRLKPTHLLIQPPVAGVDSQLTALAMEKGWVIGQWRLNGIDDIETMIRELPGVLFTPAPAPAPGNDDLAVATTRAAELVNDIAESLSPGTGPLYRGPVLLVNEVDPVMTFGHGTYLHDVLTAMGGANATPGQGWVGLSLEDVTRLNPGAIIIVRPTPSDSVDAMAAAGPMRDLQVDAIRSGRVAVLANPDAFLPSSAVGGLAIQLRGILRSFEKDRSP